MTPMTLADVSALARAIRSALRPSMAPTNGQTRSIGRRSTCASDWSAKASPADRTRPGSSPSAWRRRATAGNQRRSAGPA